MFILNIFRIFVYFKKLLKNKKENMEEIILKALERTKLSKRGLELNETDVLNSIRDMENLINMEKLYEDPIYYTHIIEHTLGFKTKEDGLTELENIKNKLINQFKNGELL